MAVPTCGFSFLTKTAFKLDQKFICSSTGGLLQSPHYKRTCHSQRKWGIFPWPHQLPPKWSDGSQVEHRDDGQKRKAWESICASLTLGKTVDFLFSETNSLTRTQICPIVWRTPKSTNNVAAQALLKASSNSCSYILGEIWPPSPWGPRHWEDPARFMGTPQTTAFLQTSGWFVPLLHRPGVVYFIGSIFPNQIVQKELPEWCNSEVTSVGSIKQFTVVMHGALVLFIFFFFPSICVSVTLILDVKHLPGFGHSQIYLSTLRFCYCGTYKGGQLESHSWNYQFSPLKLKSKLRLSAAAWLEVN